MQKFINISGNYIALCSGRQTESSREIVHTLSHRPDTELYNLFHSLPDYIEAKPEMHRVENLEAINKSMQLLKLVNMVGHFKGL